MPYVTIEGERLFYAPGRGSEEGPPVVLVHGAGGSHLHWPAELRRLPGATVYAVDLPGHGRSEGPGSDTIAGYVRTVVALFDALALERPVVIGHSMGGAIAQTLALDFPDRVTALVLVATGGRLRVAGEILNGIVEDFEKAIRLISSYVWARGTAPAIVERLGVQVLRDAGPAVVQGDFLACHRFDVLPRLGEIGAPTLVIGGTGDVLTPPKYSRYLADHIPDARLVLFEGAGHVVMLERPAEVAEVVERFLAEVWRREGDDGRLAGAD